MRDQGNRWFERDQKRDSFRAHRNLPHFAQLVLALLGCNTGNSKATFDVIDETEILSGLISADHIHTTSRVGCISLDFAISLHDCWT